MVDGADGASAEEIYGGSLRQLLRLLLWAFSHMLLLVRTCRQDTTRALIDPTCHRLMSSVGTRQRLERLR